MFFVRIDEPGRGTSVVIGAAQAGEVGSQDVAGELTAHGQDGVVTADVLGLDRGHHAGSCLGGVGRRAGPGVDEGRRERLEVMLAILVAQVRGSRATRRRPA